MGEGLFHLGRFPDVGRGNPPVVAPAVGRQEGRHGGTNPTRGRLWVAKRVGTGARTLPEVGGSSLN